MSSEAGWQVETRSPRFGPYVVEQPLGRGAMGEVYEARHVSLAKRVAVKVIKGALVGDPVARERFLREAKALAKVSHPHIVQVFDQGFQDAADGGQPFIVMELLEGETLERHLAREGALRVARAVAVMLPIISAVAAIHDEGAVHRDLKPGNVMLARRGRCNVEPVVLDLGISRWHEQPEGAERVTGSDVLLGTLPYVPPEQLRDSRAADARSDQYALGVMLFELVTGRRPFDGSDHYELMHAAMTAAAPRPSTLVGALPAGLDDVILRAMSRQRADRFPNVRSLGGALLPFADEVTANRWKAELLEGLPSPGGAASGETLADAPRDPRPPSLKQVARPPTRRRLLAIVVPSVAMALLVLVGFFGFRRVQEPTIRVPTLQISSASPPSPEVLVQGVPLVASPPLVPSHARDVPPVSVAGATGRRHADRPVADLPPRRESPVPARANAREAPPEKPASPERHHDHAEPGDDDPIDPFAPLH